MSGTAAPIAREAAPTGAGPAMIDENNATPDATPAADAVPPPLPTVEAEPTTHAEATPAAHAAPEVPEAEPPAPPPAEQLIAADHAHSEHATAPTPPMPDEAAAAESPPAPEVAVPDQAAAAESEPEVPPEAAEAPEAPPALDAPEAAPEEAPAAAPKKPRKAKAAPAAAVETDAETATAGTETVAAVATAEAAPPAEPAVESKKKWYAVKVQSGREESIQAAIERKIKIEGLEPFFGQILIPKEEVIVKKKVKVKNKKTGETTTQEKNVSKFNKKFPGYLFAEVEFNDEILYVFRETSGVGDFVGASLKRAPAPMTDAEVQSMLTGVPTPGGRGKGGRGKVVVKLDVEKGDKVRIKNGAFAGNEGEVKAITEPKDPTDTPKVTVVVTLWGRPVDVDLDYWEVDKV